LRSVECCRSESTCARDSSSRSCGARLHARPRDRQLLLGATHAVRRDAGQLLGRERGVVIRLREQRGGEARLGLRGLRGFELRARLPPAREFLPARKQVEPRRQRGAGRFLERGPRTEVEQRLIGPRDVRRRGQGRHDEGRQRGDPSPLRVVDASQRAHVVGIEARRALERFAQGDARQRIAA
jgi:hypothetical protein